MSHPTIINNFIDKHDCLNMIGVIDSLDRWESEHELDSRTLVWNSDHQDSIAFIKKYYPMVLQEAGISNLYPHVVGFYKYFPGKGMGVHSDIMDDNCKDCELSAVFYLNEEYSGGQIYFPKLNVEIKPITGSVVFYPAHLLEFDHGVRPISTGYRYAIPMCFTTDLKKADKNYI